MKPVPSLFIFLLLNFAIQITQAQNWLWAKQPFFNGYSESGPFGGGNSMAADKYGNVYETGLFGFASMQYDTDTLIAPVENDFLSKYDTGGNLLWARAATLPTGVDECDAGAVTSDIDGNVYITGNFYDNIIIDTTHLNGTPGGEEVFLAKYDPNGNALWARQTTPIGAGTYRNYGSAITTDRGGNVYITGTFFDSITFGPYTLTCPYFTGNTYYTQDVFLVKYDSAGNVLWARAGTLPTIYSWGTVMGIASDRFNNIYITGQFYDTISFGGQQLKNSSMAGDIFIAKYDDNGNVIWARQSSNHSTYSYLIRGNSIAADKEGNVYLAGSFGDTVSFGAVTLSNPVPAIYAYSYGDLMVVKFDSSGNALWGKAGAPQQQFSCTAWGVAVDNSDNVYFTGAGANAMNPITPANLSIGMGSQVFTASNPPSTYITILVELDTAGNILCGSAAPVTEMSCIATDPTGQYVYMGGGFYAAVTLGPNTLTLDNNPPNEGTSIPFVARWQPCDVVAGIPLSAAVGKTDVTCYGLCNGAATASGSGGNPPYTFLWNTQPVDTPQTITGLCAGAYSVTITDNTGATAASTVTITQPAAMVTNITATKDTLCAGDTTTLSATGTITNLVWQSSATGTNFMDIQGADDSIYATAISQTLFFRAVAGSDGCFDTSFPFKLLVYPLPVPVVNSADSIICSGDSTQVCAGDTFASYLWNTGNTSYCTTANAAGGYWVTVTDAHQCSAVSGHREISVYPVPSVSIIEHGDTLSSFGGVSYQWFLNDEPILSATGAVYIAKQAGDYAVQITDSNGCKALSSGTYVAVTGITDLAEAGISLYPNPTAVCWQLVVSNEFIGGSLEVYDAEGRLVYKSAIRNLKSDIPAVSLPAGIYLLRIASANMILTKKLVRL